MRVFIFMQSGEIHYVLFNLLKRECNSTILNKVSLYFMLGGAFLVFELDNMDTPVG